MIHRLARLVTAIIAPVALLLGASGAAAAGVTPGTAAPAACSGVLAIRAFAFHPPLVSPGQTSTATVSAVNCTGQSQAVTVIWSGRFIGPSAPGCPVLDPLAQPATFAPHGTYTAGVGYLALPSCTATQLQVTVKFQGQSGSVLAQATATLTIVQPTAG
jgi:hypothetical protein